MGEKLPRTFRDGVFVIPSDGDPVHYEVTCEPGDFTFGRSTLPSAKVGVVPTFVLEGDPFDQQALDRLGKALTDAYGPFVFNGGEVTNG